MQLEELISESLLHTPSSPIRKFLDLITKREKEGFRVHRLDIGMPHKPDKLNELCLSVPVKHNGYGQTLGFPELREIIAQDYGTTEEFVGITNGGSDALRFLVGALANNKKGDKFLTFAPTYFGFLQIAYSRGVDVIPILTRLEDGFNVPEQHSIEKVIKANNNSGRIKGIYLNNPSNPTGMVFSEDQLKMLAEITKKYNLAVIYDDVYNHLIFNGKYKNPFEIFGEEAVVINSFSKKFNLPSVRMGYIVSLSTGFWEQLKKQYQKILCPSELGQRAVLLAYEHIGEKELKETLEIYGNNAKLIYKKLQEQKFIDIGVKAHMPNGTFYLPVQVGGIDNTESLLANVLLQEEFLKKYGGTVTYTPMEDFYGKKDFFENVDDIRGRNELRLALREPVDELLNGADILYEGIKEYKENITRQTKQAR